MSDDRREMLEAALDQAEEGTLEAPIEKEIEVNDDPIQTENEGSTEESSQENPDRDEKGRFKAKTEEPDTEGNQGAEPELVAEASDVPDEEIKRPTTWKKEYVEVWEKMQSGKPLDKAEFARFAEYANQREAEYNKGVSAYND